MGRRGGDPYPYVGKAQMEGLFQAEAPSKEWGVGGPNGAPRLGILNWKDKPLEYIALKN